jgi:hypothetical protein
VLSAQSKEWVLVPFFLFPKTERQKEEGEWESIFVGHVIAAIGLWKDGFSLCTIQRNGSLNRCIGSMDGIRGGQKLPNRPESDETEKEFDCWVVVGRVTG